MKLEDLKAKTETSITTEKTFKLNYEQTCAALGVPLGSNIYIDVPDGGDFSGERLEIGHDISLNVHTKETST